MPQYLTVAEAAKLKNVTTSAVYLAVQEKRLPHTRILGKIALKPRDVEKWTPISYRGRPGAKGRRPLGMPMSADVKAQISATQKQRWRKRRQKDSA